MRSQLQALTLSYKHAPIAIREMVALHEQGVKNLLQKIKEFTGAAEALVLSTCNRTEVYYVADRDLSRELIKLIALEKGFVAPGQVSPFFNHLPFPGEAMKHLFQVALGLESQVVGDLQILNQVKQAYQWSAAAGLAGPLLHRLLATVFGANKRVVNETGFKDGAASASYATVELVETLTKDLVNPRVLLIGLGDIGTKVCRNFQKTVIRNLVIINRTLAKSSELAAACGARAGTWDRVWEEIAQADVVISSVPGDAFFISREAVAGLGTGGYKFFIDLSMPRSIDPALESLPDTCVYNIDSIRNRASEALEKRMAAIPAVHTIITEALADFQTWAQEYAGTAAIRQLKVKLEEIRRQEVARYGKHLGDGEKEVVDLLTRDILQKIIKLPVLELKAASRRGESEALLAGLQNLFSLEEKDLARLNRQFPMHNF